MVRKSLGGLLVDDEVSPGRNIEVSKFQYKQSAIHFVGVTPTCSKEVLMNTGGPFKQVIKIGMSFLRNAGYMGPVM